MTKEINVKGLDLRAVTHKITPDPDDPESLVSFCSLTAICKATGELVGEVTGTYVNSNNIILDESYFSVFDVFDTDSSLISVYSDFMSTEGGQEIIECNSFLHIDELKINKKIRGKKLGLELIKALRSLIDNYCIVSLRPCPLNKEETDPTYQKDVEGLTRYYKGGGFFEIAGNTLINFYVNREVK